MKQEASKEEEELSEKNTHGTRQVQSGSSRSRKERHRVKDGQSETGEEKGKRKPADGLHRQTECHGRRIEQQE